MSSLENKRENIRRARLAFSLRLQQASKNIVCNETFSFFYVLGVLISSSLYFIQFHVSAIAFLLRWLRAIIALHNSRYFDQLSTFYLLTMFLSLSKNLFSQSHDVPCCFSLLQYVMWVFHKALFPYVTQEFQESPLESNTFSISHPCCPHIFLLLFWKRHISVDLDLYFFLWGHCPENINI